MRPDGATSDTIRRPRGGAAWHLS